MTDEPDVVLEESCEYVCEGNQWVLVQGTAPPGYYCPDVLGDCLGEGVTLNVEPDPLPPSPPIPLALASLSGGEVNLDNASNAGEYQFDSTTDTLYFSRGIALKGFRFLTKIPLTELRERFPAIAAEVELLKNAKSLIGFAVKVPAIPMAKQKN